VTSGDLEAALSPLKKLKNLVSTSIKLKRALKRSLSKGLLEGRLTEKSGALSKALSERLLISTKEGNEGEEEGEK
jgi:signal transduction histidine kinase